MENDETTLDLELDEELNQDDQDNQYDNQDQNQDNSKSKDDEKDWKAEALKYKAILDRNKNKPEKRDSTKKSDGLDYAEKSYLISNGIKREELSFVQDEFKASGMKDIDSLLDNDYFKAKLEKHRALNETKNAIPKGNRSGDIANDSIEYYASKPIEEVPQEFRAKVVNYKLERETKKGVFYNS